MDIGRTGNGQEGQISQIGGDLRCCAKLKGIEGTGLTLES